jgi:hypothetical protein
VTYAEKRLAKAARKADLNVYDKYAARMFYGPLLNAFIDGAADEWIDTMDARLAMLDPEEKSIMWDDIIEIVQKSDDVSLLPDEWLALLYFRDVSVSLKRRRPNGRGFLTSDEERRVIREVTFRAVLWKLSPTSEAVQLTSSDNPLH